MSSMSDALLRTLIDETAARVIQVLQKPTLIPATVIDASNPASVEVLVDGDTDAVAVQSIVGAVATGARVMVMFYPPAGAVIVGTVPVDLAEAEITAASGWAVGAITHLGRFVDASDGTLRASGFLSFQNVSGAPVAAVAQMGTISAGSRPGFLMFGPGIVTSTLAAARVDVTSAGVVNLQAVVGGTTVANNQFVTAPVSWRVLN